jgi:hypothetical protein
MMFASADTLIMARLHVTSSLFIVGALLSAVLTHGAELNTNQPRLRGLTEQVRGFRAAIGSHGSCNRSSAADEGHEPASPFAPH